MHNPLNNISARALRIFFTSVVVFVFAICTWNALRILVFEATANDQCAWRPIKDRPDALLITDVVPDGVSDRAGIKNGDTLLKIDGKSFEGINAQSIINSVPLGDYATYLIERNGARFEVKVQILRVFNIVYLAQFLLGLGFLIVGYIVIMTKPTGQTQRMFAHYSILSMLFFGLYVINGNPTEAMWIIVTLGISTSISKIFAPPIFIRFFFFFPIKKKAFNKKWINWLLYGLSCLLLTIAFVGKFGTTPLGLIGALVPYLFYVIGLFIFVHSYFKVEKIRRKQLRPILISIVIGISALAYTIVLFTLNPFAIFLTPVLSLPSLFILSVPIAFGYSIFRYRLMDIDLIVKRSLIYGTVTATIAAMYLLIVYGIGNVIAYFLGTEENRLLNIFAFVIIALAFDPIKRRTQKWIDRYFYQERYNYQRALLEFSQELPRQINLKQILDSIINRISSTMHVEKIAVVLCDDIEGCLSIAKNIDQSCCEFSNAEHGLIELLRTRQTPQSLALLGDESESIQINQHDKENILRSGIVLAVPMLLKDRLIGTINVGPKLSGRVYSQEDIDLLSTVASQAAIAIENSRLHMSEIEKEKIQEELTLARHIQQSLLPKANPTFEGLDIAGISIPALSVGGDYFDYIQLGPKQFLIIVADVSGKGMSAALYMSKIQGMIQIAAHMYHSPKEMLVHVNRRLYDGIERKSFITMILALFDLDKKIVKICRAGHNKAIIGTNGTLEHLNASGIGLGLERGPIFEQTLEEIQRPLTHNGLYVFYSDGLTEAMNEEGIQFGEENICSILNSHHGIPASALQQTVVAAAEKYRGTAEQHDDITIVVVKSQ
jgi:sigma-B regulation protein RsbU (phosphoserine phosphatase)